MVINITKKIEWRDGAAIIVTRLTKAQEEELEKSVVSKYADLVKESAIEKESGEFIDDEGKFIGGPKTKNLSSIKVFERLYAIVQGWEGVTDEAGEPIPYNDSTKYGIFSFIVQDTALLQRINAFLRGPLGNSKAGLTASSNTGGTSDTAAPASEKTENQPATGEQTVNTSSNQNAG